MDASEISRRSWKCQHGARGLEPDRLARREVKARGDRDLPERAYLLDFREDVREGAARSWELRGDGSAKAHVLVSRREDGKVAARAGGG